jgi:hypothetical protein
MYWINVTQDGGQVTWFCEHNNELSGSMFGIYWVTEQLVSSQEGLGFTELAAFWLGEAYSNLFTGLDLC